MPTTHVRDAQAGKRVSVTLDRAGRVAVDKVVVDRQDLVGALGNRLRQPGQADFLVVVRADGGVPYAMVRGVLEDARQAGARRLAIATTAAADADSSGDDMDALTIARELAAITTQTRRLAVWSVVVHVAGAVLLLA